MDSTGLPRPTVLVVGCEPERTSGLCARLETAGTSATVSACGAPAQETIAETIFDVVVLFACAPDEEGLRVLLAARARHAYAPFVVVAHDDSLGGAITAFRTGAFDYHVSTADDEAIVASVRRAIEDVHLHREVAQLRRRLRHVMPGGLVGRSVAIEKVLDLIERVAPTGVSVLVTGETGTGKELVSRAIHDLSPRRRKGFFPVSCATLPEHIMESVLFGHVRGAFTGALETRKGIFEHAPGGTILLDEIDSLGVDLQAKLLRVLEERTIRRVGDSRDIPVDLRVISSSNRNLQNAVERGDFREDLFYRLSAFPIQLPPLRERLEDIPLLAIHFRDRFAEETGMEPLEIHRCCMEWLCGYAWPGNVRELKHTIERAMLLSRDPSRITCETLEHLRGDRATVSWDRPISQGWSLRRLEREYIGAVLDCTNGNKGKAAELLGVDRSTLYRKIAVFEEEESAVPSGREARTPRPIGRWRSSQARGDGIRGVRSDES